MESFLKLSLLCAVAASQKSNLYDLSAIDIDGNNVTLSRYAGNVSLVVNVATY
jgi:hypothetical protein